MRLVERVHELLSEKLSEGDLTVDATAGNGWDTAFLASKVGSSGSCWHWARASMHWKRSHAHNGKIDLPHDDKEMTIRSKQDRAKRKATATK